MALMIAVTDFTSFPWQMMAKVPGNRLTVRSLGIPSSKEDPEQISTYASMSTWGINF
jgi:hypothetical protein